MPKYLTCADCGLVFEDLPYPASIHPDDDHPQCDSCIERMLDEHPSAPLNREKVERILKKAFDKPTE